MWKSGTWPGGVAMESLNNINSAGSCDSVISMNSGYSDDSMEHLSAEERACLMYLEETIEALEVQEDSGLSNDEPEACSKAEQSADEHLSVIVNPPSLISASVSGEGLLPVDQDVPCPEPKTVTISEQTEQSTVDKTSAPALAAKSEDSVVQTDLSVGLAAESFPNTELSDSFAGLSTDLSEIDPGIIPPPSDFMDQADSSSCAEKVEDVTPPTEFEPTEESFNKTSESSSLNKILPPVTVSDTHTSSPSRVTEPKSPPAVAPKPKKLPSNIVLKTHKPSVPGFDVNSASSGANKVLIDPQKVRMEALRKLGLLKSNEEDTSPCKSPKLPSQTRRSWGASSPPMSPATPTTPPPTVFHNPPAVSNQPESLTSKTASPCLVPGDLPVPAAFRDPIILDLSKTNTEPSVKSPPVLAKKLTPVKFTGTRSASMNHHSHLGLRTEMTRQNSLEVGQVVSSNQSLLQLRNNRPRPSSLGSGKDFSHGKEDNFQAANNETDSQKSLVDQTGLRASGESLKLPRSQGISVHICPYSENGDNRREALKKLGLLRD